MASFGGVLLPAWIRIEEAGQEPIRLEIEAARRVQFEPETFSPIWLLTSEEAPREEPGSPSPGL